MKYIVITTLLLGALSASAQNFTRQDSLRGSITPEREWWDLNYYDLNLKVQPDKEFIAGYNIIRYKVLEENDVIQIDLKEPLKELF